MNLSAILIIFLVGVAAAVAIVGVTTTPVTSSDKIKQFQSIDELKSYLNSSSPGYFGAGTFQGETTNGGALQGVQTSTPPSTTKTSSDQGNPEDYSKTNVQVAGVDEPDFVKSDGKYIYTISGNSVQIVDAFPADQAKIVGEINFTNTTPQQIFINNNKLVVFGYQNNYYPYPLIEKSGTGISSQSSIAYPVYFYSSKTFVNVYDVSNHSSPVLTRNFSVDGDYFDARMIGDYVYMVVNQPFYYYNQNISLPQIYEKGEARPVTNFPIYYFDNPDYSFRFVSVIAFNSQNDSEDVNTNLYLMGSANTIFVSLDNLYITYQKSMSQQEYYNRIIKDVIIPIVPINVGTNLNSVLNSNESPDQKNTELNQILQNYTQTLNTDQQAELQRNFLTRYLEVAIQIAKDFEKTVIHKISLNGKNVIYVSSGEVPGYVLNQFSMDENNGYFRIATTSGRFTGTNTTNNLYVLDSNMKMVGSLENLAPGETIYSARFIGNRAYLVTFKRVDPLFVIDLTNPSNPTVLGQLKITGFSDYLHPYDENHLIGVGRATDETGRLISGVKLALFDVSDISNPKEISNYVIGGSGSSSEVLYDHHAFLFNKDKNLLVIPVLEYFPNSITGYYDYQGAYVFNVTLENGFQLRGTISHADNSTNNSYYYWYGSYSVRRSMYTGNVLYTISDSKIKMNDLSTLGEINSVKLPIQIQPPIYYGLPVETFIGIARTA